MQALWQNQSKTCSENYSGNSQKTALNPPSRLLQNSGNRGRKHQQFNGSNVCTVCSLRLGAFDCRVQGVGTKSTLKRHIRVERLTRQLLNFLSTPPVDFAHFPEHTWALDFSFSCPSCAWKLTSEQPEPQAVAGKRCGRKKKIRDMAK